MERMKKANFKGHLLTAISYLIPIVCGAGFLIAVGNALGGSVKTELISGHFSFFDLLSSMGAYGLQLLPMVIATGIAFSIAGKPGIAPGFIVGLTAKAMSAGFIGGLLGGFIAGFIALAILTYVKVPSWAKGLMPTLIVPLFASLLSGLIMAYIIGIPIAAFTSVLTSFLTGMGSSSLLIFGAVIGGLAIVDFGGPINKTVFAFVLTLQAQGINGPVTALQLVNTATPIAFGLAFFIAKLLHKNIYSKTEIETLKSTVPMGVINIVEGCIPLVLNDIVRSLIACVIGGVAGGAATMVLGADASVPFGGVLMLATMSQPLAGLAGIVVNVIVTGVGLALIKKNKPVEDDTAIEAVEEDIDLAELQISL